MKPIHYVLLTIAGIVLLVVAFNWDSFINLFKSKPTPSTKSKLEICKESQASLQDGTPCTICDTIDTTLSITGNIKDGICIRTEPAEKIVVVPVPTPTPTPNPNPPPRPAVFKLKVTNTQGAPIYKKDNAENFAAVVPPMKLPFGQNVVAFGTVKTADTYYQIQGGWLSGKDVQII